MCDSNLATVAMNCIIGSHIRWEVFGIGVELPVPLSSFDGQHTEKMIPKITTNIRMTVLRGNWQCTYYRMNVVRMLLRYG